MRRRERGMSWLLAAALLLSAAVPSAVMAEEGNALEELNQILEAQMQSGDSESALAQYLQLDALGKAMEEKGMNASLRLGLTEGTLETLYLEDTVPADAFLQFGFRLDPQQACWLLEAAGGAGEQSLIDLSLYGDAELLAFSAPQLYSGAAAVRAGNLAEQYENSALKVLLEENGEVLSLPDLDMSFYPQEGSAEAEESPFVPALEQLMADAEAETTVTKTELEDGSFVYTQYTPSEAILEVYDLILSEYLGYLEQMEEYAYVEIEGSVDEVITAMDTVLPDEIAIDYYVQDNLVQKIAWAMDITAGMTNEMAEDPDEMLGIVSYEVVFENPADPLQTIAFTLDMTDTAGPSNLTVQIRKHTEESDALTRTVIDVTAAADGQEVYSDTVYEQTFDAQTGAWDLRIDFTDSYSEEEVVAALHSTFTNLGEGQGFTWTVEELSLTAEGQSAGLTAELTVTADPGAIETPQELRTVLELNSGELMGFAAEAYTNLETWMQEALTAWNNAIAGLTVLPETGLIAESEVIETEAQPETEVPLMIETEIPAEPGVVVETDPSVETEVPAPEETEAAAETEGMIHIGPQEETPVTETEGMLHIGPQEGDEPGSVGQEGSVTTILTTA